MLRITGPREQEVRVDEHIKFNTIIIISACYLEIKPLVESIDSILIEHWKLTKVVCQRRVNMHLYFYCFFIELCCLVSKLFHILRTIKNNGLRIQ